MAFKSIDYSFFRITKEMLYLPLSSEVRFRTKQLIDVLGYRLSKGGASSVIVAVKSAGFSLLPLYPLVSLGAALAWAGMIFPLVRNWSRIEGRAQALRLPVFGLSGRRETSPQPR
jgi:ATP/ADP translocase